jgi:ribosome biogenesis protein ERB1
MKWYKDEEHIGYDRDARKIARKARQDRLDALLARNDSGKALRTIYDEYNDEDIVLSKEELQMVQRIREGRFPHVEVSSCVATVVVQCLWVSAAVLTCVTHVRVIAA